MNRKDFEEIGRVLRLLAPGVRAVIGMHFANQFDGHHSGFDKARFLKSCGVETEKTP